MDVEWIGWFSSAVLILTLSRQLYTQWKVKDSKGISKWLYIGQFLAEIGFIVYAWKIRNWVFAFTNTILLLENIIGLALVLHYRRGARRMAGSQTKSEPTK